MKDSNNRSTLIIAVVVLVVAGWFFTKAFRKKHVPRGEVVEDVTETAGEPRQEDMGKPVAQKNAVPPAPPAVGVPAPTVSPENEAERRTFAAIVDTMRDCLEMPRGASVENSPVAIESLNANLQNDFGTAANQGDRWMTWKLRTPGGEERLMRLDYFEDEMGVPQREVHYFSMRSETDVFPIDIPPEKSLNPPEGYIEDILKEGSVHYQEKARYSIFPSGERVDYVEKNGVLAEIEVTKGEKFFRCDNIKSQESCHCVKEE